MDTRMPQFGLPCSLLDTSLLLFYIVGFGVYQIFLTNSMAALKALINRGWHDE